MHECMDAWGMVPFGHFLKDWPTNFHELTRIFFYFIFVRRLRRLAQIILALSSWLLALSKQQALRIMLAGFSLFSFPASYLPSFPSSLFS